MGKEALTMRTILVLVMAAHVALMAAAGPDNQAAPMKTPTRGSSDFNAQERAEVFAAAEAIFKHSDYRLEVSFDRHLAVATSTRAWARKLGVEDHWKVLLALFYTESGFRLDAKNLDSLGISQVREQYREAFEKEIKDPDFQRFKDYSKMDTQVAVGVAAFKQHLRAARLEGGSTWAAVRFYNGRGDGGRPGRGGGFHHLQKVKRNYKRFFGDDNGPG